MQSQMWTMTIIHASNILLLDIYVNSTDVNQEVGFKFSSLNTDGADTVYADNITFRYDSIAPSILVSPSWESCPLIGRSMGFRSQDINLEAHLSSKHRFH